MKWSSIAAEVRAMILGALIKEQNIAHCAAVCREWQAHIEKQTFHSLTLTVEDVPELKKISPRSLAHIRHIWFCIKLLECHFPDGDSYETEEMMEYNRKTVQVGVESIFGALLKRPIDGDLKLDLSVYSPSDSQHHLKYVRFEPAGFPNISTISQELSRPSGPQPDSCRVGNSPVISIESVDQIFPDISFSDNDHFWARTQVPCVTHLSLRRQTRRRWDPVAVSQLIARLPNLQNVCFETWREWSRWLQHCPDIRLERLFKSLISADLKRVSIFEDLNETYVSPGTAYISASPDAQVIRTANTRVIGALAKASLTLEQFSAAFMVDADRFWDACRPDWTWRRLSSLSLTSRDLVPDASPKRINDLLHSAAQAAKRMPKLQTMEMWNGSPGYASVFRYRSVKARRPSDITWRGSWELTLEVRVVKAWGTISVNDNIQVVNEMIPCSQFIRSHGDVIRVLQLEHPVACSAWILQGAAPSC
ncbi:hypothetical protein BU24DRAFT_399914 [Aaosphaeria arxii CBS 175.79]|uniref:DUF6546 domain-containing protein n=1 Tax=Aaosphaeria arxii CBS 175.79 TaxID=1450172 RepID=A0A6A5XC87_9PLEO|nr:uncharacterized protein BU24DRAFT_399914 [Aaosphaeria arxii CBS 175.79]KAF2010513.1 hypothetical protein BU24DRAFT_399914 [Aaosphaeria arxii CBS 175.79]